MLKSIVMQGTYSRHRLGERSALNETADEANLKEVGLIIHERFFYDPSNIQGEANGINAIH